MAAVSSFQFTQGDCSAYDACFTVRHYPLFRFLRVQQWSDYSGSGNERSEYTV